MAWKIIWTRQAWNDLEVVAEYISRDSAGYAAVFVREIRDAARSLRVFPRRGRIVPEFKDPAIRELLVRKYRLLYRVENETVFILAFIHGARDLSNL